MGLIWNKSKYLFKSKLILWGKRYSRYVMVSHTVCEEHTVSKPKKNKNRKHTVSKGVINLSTAD